MVLKSNKVKINIIIIFSLLSLIFGFYNFSKFILVSRNTNQVDPVLLLRDSGLYTPLFIHVDGNWTDTEGNFPWCTGNGTWDDPYIIENCTIDAGYSPIGSGILIENSLDIFFIIRNCSIFNASALSTYHSGIRLLNVSDGIIIGNNCSNNGENGIRIDDCNNVTISSNNANNNDLGIACMYDCSNSTIFNNTAIENYRGIVISFADNNSINNNTLINNSIGGIHIFQSRFNTIINNTSEKNDYGIYVGSADLNEITHNHVNNNTRGINLYNADYNLISGNTIEYNNDTGIFLERSNYNQVKNNNLNNNLEYCMYVTADCIGNEFEGNSCEPTYEDAGGYLIPLTIIIAIVVFVIAGISAIIILVIVEYKEKIKGIIHR